MTDTMAGDELRMFLALLDEADVSVPNHSTTRDFLRTVIAQARAEGYRAGLEAAAKLCERVRCRNWD